jgi:hypothetical protein
MKFVILAAALLLPASAPAPEAVPARPEQADAPDTHRTPNAHQDQPGCTPILQQVAGEDRKYRGTRLNEQPPAQLLAAVDRQVGGCREVTFLRRNVAPGTAMPQVGFERK